MRIREVRIEKSVSYWDLSRKYDSLDGTAEFIESFEELEKRLEEGHTSRKSIFHQTSYPDLIDSMSARFHVSTMEVLRLEKLQGEVLYVACSFGLGVKIAKALEYDVIGIDIDELAVEEACLRGLDVRKMNALRMDFGDKRFDVAMSRNYLIEDYFTGKFKDDLTRAFEEQERVLRKGGILVNYSQRLVEILKEKPDGTAYFDNRYTKYALLSYEFLQQLPFRELRRYELVYPTLREFVDVLEK